MGNVVHYDFSSKIRPRVFIGLEILLEERAAKIYAAKWLIPFSSCIYLPIASSFTQQRVLSSATDLDK